MSVRPQRACPLGWESRPQTNDGHPHDWHMVVIESWPGHTEAMTVCRVCSAPRCGTTFEDNPCLERRHHDGLHIYEDGSFAPLGGYLP